MRMTPKEFAILMSANVERIYDEYERMTMFAMMNRQAYHAKKLKPSDMFKRPNDDKNTNRTAEDVKERQNNIMKKLSKYKQFKDLV